MKNRTAAIILTVISALLCGCLGLVACGFGIAIAVGAPVTTSLNGVSTSQTLPVPVGIGLICLSVISIAVPIVIGVLTLRKKKPAEGTPGEVLPPQEPLPPAS